MAGCAPKKYAKGGAVRKPIKMANGGMVPPAPATQSAMSAGFGKPMTQTGDAASAQRAIDAFKAANPNAGSGGQSVQAPPAQAPATQSAMSAGFGKPMTQTGDAAAAQRAMAAFQAANPASRSGSQSIRPPTQSSMMTPNVGRMPPQDQSRPTVRPGPGVGPRPAAPPKRGPGGSRPRGFKDGGLVTKVKPPGGRGTKSCKVC